MFKIIMNIVNVVFCKAPFHYVLAYIAALMQGYKDTNVFAAACCKTNRQILRIEYLSLSNKKLMKCKLLITSKINIKIYRKYRRFPSIGCVR